MVKLSTSGRISRSGRFLLKPEVKQQVQPVITIQQKVVKTAEQLAIEKKNEAIMAKNARLAKEESEWAQAEKLAGKIQLGKSIRYDPRSSVGKKINVYLDNWALASARRAEGGKGALWIVPERKPIVKQQLQEKKEVKIITTKTTKQLQSQVTAPSFGAGTFTKAVDVGGGRMQDAFFRYSGGVITETKLIGKSFKQTQRFKDKSITAQTRSDREAFQIQPFNPQHFAFESGFKREKGEATKSFFTQSIPEFVTGFGKTFGNLLLMDTRELQRTNPLRVFFDTGLRPGGKEFTIVQPQFGTVTPESKGGFITRTTTGFEELRRLRVEAGIPSDLIEAPIPVIAQRKAREIEKDVMDKFQAQVQSGELTTDKATEMATKEFFTRFQKETSGLSGLSAEPLRIRSGEKISKQVVGILPAVGLTALSLTPTGALVGGSLSIAGGSFLATRGKSKIDEGDISGGIIDIGTGALFAAGGFFSLGTAGARLESQITASRLATLRKQPISLGGDYTIGKRGVITKVSGSRSTIFGTQEFEIVSPIFTQKTLPTGSQTFSIVGGRFTQQTRLQPFRFMGGFSTPQVPILKSTESFTFIGRGLSPISSTGKFTTAGFDVTFPKDFKTAIGTVDFVREGKRITIPFGGISKQSKSSIYVISGSLTKGRIFSPEAGGQRIFVIKPTSAGTLVDKTSSAFLDFKVIKIGRGSIKPQPHAPIVPTKIAPVIKPIFKPSPISSTVMRTSGSFGRTSVPVTGIQFTDTGGRFSQVLQAAQMTKLQPLQTSQIGAGFSLSSQLATITKPTVSIVTRSPIPILSFLPATSQRFDSAQIQPQISFQKSVVETATKTEQKVITSLISSTTQKTGQAERQASKTITVPSTPSIPFVPVIPIFSTSPPFTPLAIIPSIPFLGIIVPPFPSLGGAVGKKKGKSFIPQVMSGNKWINVSKKTMTRDGALSRASKGADNTTSRRMRILPKNKAPEIQGGGGWSLRKHKFRAYRKSKGKKIPLPNSYIERAKYAIDTPGEVEGLSIKRFTKQSGWLVPKLKTKKRKKRNGKTKKKSN